MNDRLVWIDCEMTGLDLRADALIEVAALVTDFELNVLGEGVDIVIRPPDEALEQMGDFVRSMHESSGLLAELEKGVTLAEAEERTLAYLHIDLLALYLTAPDVRSLVDAAIEDRTQK